MSDDEDDDRDELARRRAEKRPVLDRPPPLSDPLAALLGIERATQETGEPPPVGPRPNWCGPCSARGFSVRAVINPETKGTTGRCTRCIERERVTRERLRAAEQDSSAALDAKGRRGNRPG